MGDKPEYAGNLLVVCSSCKRIRDDEGGWSEFDPSRRLPHQHISHAICPECGEQRYPQYADRRRYPRAYVQLFVELRPRFDNAEVFVTEGATVNISRSGLLALVRDLGPIVEDCKCTVRFTEADDIVAPNRVSGVVVRSGPRGIDFEVAIDFDSILEALSAPTS